MNLLQLREPSGEGHADHALGQNRAVQGCATRRLSNGSERRLSNSINALNHGHKNSNPSRLDRADCQAAGPSLR